MKQILIFLIVGLPFTSNAQWQWAKRIGSNYDVAASPFFADSNNNIYVSGNYQYECYFQSDTLRSNGYTDMFIAKYDQNGNEIWIKNFGGNNPFSTNESLRTYVDNTRNFIIAVGTFQGTLTIDGNSVVSFGSSDVFIAKFDFSGNCIWLKHGGGSGNDNGYAFTFDSNNDIFLTGSNADTATFDSFTVPPGNLFAKYDLSGTCLFAQRKYSGLSIIDIKSMNGDLILSGTTNNNSINIDTISVSLLAGSKALLAKINSSGEIYWLKTYGSYSNTTGNSIYLDAQNNIYYAGYFGDSATFNSITIYHSSTTLPDFFLAKLDNNGNAQWVRQCYTTGLAHGYAVSVDGDSNVYFSGDFNGTAQFGNFNVSAGTRSDFFISRYNSNGDCLGVRNFGVATSLNNIIVDNNGNVIVGGQFIETVTIGSQNLSSSNAINPDVFIAKADAITDISGLGRTANNQLVIYANPTAGKCSITVPDDFLHEKNLILSVFDNSGKLLQKKELEMNEDKIKLNLESEAKGIYNVILSNGGKSYSGKIIIE